MWCAAAAAVTSAVLLGGCGGTKASHTVASVATTTQTVITSSHAPVPLGRDVIKKITGKPAKAQGVTSAPSDEVNATGAKRVDPCTLVTRAQAHAILKRPVGQPSEAPQGPTCIYTAKGAKNFITLAVDSLAFSKIKPQSLLRNRVQLTVAGRTAFCGEAGGQQLIVPLINGKYLAVAAPCPIAVQFAAIALKRYY
jgi:hypothetical protein